MNTLTIILILSTIIFVYLQKRWEKMESLLDKISDFTVLYCQNLGVRISPLKLQKLLYYIQSWHIVKFDKDILFEEMPEAWVNGPVYRPIYNKFKDKFFRNEAFPNNMSEEEISEKLEKSLKDLALDKDKEKLIMSVLNVYGVMSDEKLVLLTHKEEPWNTAREGLSPIERSDKKISKEVIFNYYNRRIKEKQNA